MVRLSLFRLGSSLLLLLLWPAIASARWYAPTSPFNTPIPQYPLIAENTPSLLAAFESCVGSCLFMDYNYTPTIYYSTPTTPTVPVQIDIGVCDERTVYVPIPAGAAPDPGTEGEMTIAAADGTEYDLYEAQAPGLPPKGAKYTGGQCPAVGAWTATEIATTNWQTGTGSEAGSPRGSGIASGAGTILQQDVQNTPAGTWDHALAFAYHNTCTSLEPWCPITAPALYEDGRGVSQQFNVPEGTRFQLDPSLNCATWPTLTAEWQRQMCRTLQTYGAFVVDSNTSGYGFSVQQRFSLTGGYRYPWLLSGNPYLPTDLLTHFRILAWLPACPC